MKVCIVKAWEIVSSIIPIAIVSRMSISLKLRIS